MKQPRSDKGGLVRAGESWLFEQIPEQPLSSPDPVVQKAVDRLGGAIAKRQSSTVLQLPLWHEQERGTPNSFLRSALFSAIQGKDRRFVKGEIIASSKDMTIKFTGERLNQDDLTVWETLVHVSRGNPLGNALVASAHFLLKTMGLPTGGTQHKQLHNSIIRLQGAVVEIAHDRMNYAGSLIDASVEDQVTKQYAILLNPNLIKLYGPTEWTALNWNQRTELRGKPLALALHGYYSTHQRPFGVKLGTLREYTGSANSQTASFKRQVKAALQELVRVQFLASFSFDGDKVIVSKV